MILTGVEFFVVVEKCCGCPKLVGERKIGVVGPAVVAELVDTSVGEPMNPKLAVREEPTMVGQLVLSVVMEIWGREESERLEGFERAWGSVPST